MLRSHNSPPIMIVKKKLTCKLFFMQTLANHLVLLLTVFFREEFAKSLSKTLKWLRREIFTVHSKSFKLTQTIAKPSVFCTIARIFVVNLCHVLLFCNSYIGTSESRRGRTGMKRKAEYTKHENTGKAASKTMILMTMIWFDESQLWKKNIPLCMSFSSLLYIIEISHVKQHEWSLIRAWNNHPLRVMAKIYQSIKN